MGNGDKFISLGSKGDLLLDSSKDGIDLADCMTFSSNACRIFAEKVKVTKDIVIGAKEVAIYCLKFEVEESKLAKDDAGKAKPIILDLMGKGGDQPKPREPGHEDMPTGGDGKPGGSLILAVVEGLDTLIRENLLYINVSGGKGHDGDTNHMISGRDGAWNDASLYPPGGNGGNGGNGGSVTISVPALEAAAIDKLSSIVGNANSSLTWPETLDRLNLFLPDLKRMDLSLKDTSLVTLSAYEASLEAYLRYALMSKNLVSAIKKVEAFILSPQYPKSTAIDTEAIATARTLQALAQKTLEAKEAPGFVLESISAAFAAVPQRVADWVSIGSPETAKGLQNALANANAEVIGASMNVAKRIPPDTGAILQLLEDIVKKRLQGIKDLCKIDGGGHGIGGSNDQFDFGPRPKGDDGHDGETGTAKVSYFNLGADVGQQESKLVYAFPDQCEKLLADAQTLSSTDVTGSAKIEAYFKTATTHSGGGVGRA